MSKVRICFLGTPEFAVTCLKSLLNDEHYEVVGVVSQPDRPAGRKLQLTPSPVKQLALEHGLPVVTPESLRKEPDAVEIIKSWKAEVGVVVAFGQILTEDFMALFPYGCVNVHGSLLPLWRGAAPIQRSIEAGDRETGVALQKMVKKLDAGDVIGVRKIQITEMMDALELHDHLARLGAELLSLEMMDWIRGNLVPVPQDESLVTYAKKIEKEESKIDWSKSACSIQQKMRGFVYGPGTFTLFQGKKIKLHKAAVVEASSLSLKSSLADAKPGTIVAFDQEALYIQTGEALLKLIELQPESRNRMKASDFIKGHQIKEGDLFGDVH